MCLFAKLFSCSRNFFHFNIRDDFAKNNGFFKEINFEVKKRKKKFFEVNLLRLNVYVCKVKLRNFKVCYWM